MGNIYCYPGLILLKNKVREMKVITDLLGAAYGPTLKIPRDNFHVLLFH